MVAEIPNRALTDEAPVYQRPMAEPEYLADVQRLDLDALAALETPAVDTPSRRAGAGERRSADAAGVADHRQQALGVSPVRPHGADQHREHARAGRRRRPHQGHGSRARAVGRRQRPLLLPGSVPRRDAGRRRSRAQRRVRRGAAARRDQLPELRQPRTAGDHVAVRQGRRGHRRRLPRARRADHRRQRQPVQRNRRPGDLSDAGDWRRRPARARRSRREPPLPALRRRHRAARRRSR